MPTVTYTIPVCTSWRAPRTLGALVGFFVGAISNSGNSTGADPGNLQESLQGLPGTGNQKDLVKALQDLRGNTPSSPTSSGTDYTPLVAKGDLSTLCAVGKAVDKYVCFLDPLTGHLYDTVSPVFGMTYVSWVIYLLKHLKQGLEMMYQDFNGINCQQSGCEKKDDCNKAKCTGGNHGTDGICNCLSMVSCRGVHSVLYRYGFSYAGGVLSPGDLHTWLKKQEDITCSRFFEQMYKVLYGTTKDGNTTDNLLENLLTAVRQYKYQCRMPFGLYIGVYWSIVLVYLLWSMTFNLDLIHIQSHWRSPRSYLVPLQRLLADGSRNVKRVCTIGYFQDSGDRLLSLGVSDVYL
ncbi:variant erythrocyte surface antigen alpha subunit, putative [Babesia ovis]|uniref:Variant erythrocyte surface antigen alpha subunit, putative n=1 Tax=Babesia ovis TaxID=5869 RepID=A0A9W5TE78_BABOV|nr:variant erythrocyte surface antigen alpha subunit, putative [Babesia ovis]